MLRLVGDPASMTSIRSWRDWSAVVAVWSCSQLMGVVEMAAHMAVARPSSSVRAWVEQFGLGAGRSSGRWSLVGALVPDG